MTAELRGDGNADTDTLSAETQSEEVDTGVAADTFPGEDPDGALTEKALALVDFVIDTIDELIELLDTESAQLHSMNTEALTRFHARKHNLIGQYEEALGDLRNDHMPALSAEAREDLRVAMEDLRRAVEKHDRALQAMTRANQSVLSQIADAVSRVGSAARPTTYNRSGRATDTVKPKPVAGYLNDNF
ncbi:hypothetical protein [Fodinicurvata sp. EGI_FJ10296]|uniref:hypothetical protein n=1 Tax=Fodinicurvata sp. EGI_FJ10296 TaxID=3231908 RepID=UPI003452B294